MEYFGIEGWVAVSALAAVATLAVLHVLARRLEQERKVLDLRQRAEELRHSYTARLAAIRAREHGEVVEVDVIE